MEISIIIPSKDRNSILFESLDKAYRAIKQISAEIIVINDSKTDPIILKSEWLDKVKVFNNPKSGVASARNLGASKALSDLILFMDDDMWIAEENVLTTIALHKQLPSNSCLNLNWVYPEELQIRNKTTQFGRYLTYFGFDTFKGWCRGLNWDDNKIFPAQGITSQYLSFLKETFLRSGGYDEKFPHAGFEDHEFGKRLIRLGVQPYIYPLSLLYHNEADRMEVKPWLARKKRGGETKRVAVEMGVDDLAYHYNGLKAFVYKLIDRNQSFFFLLLKVIPNHRMFDFAYNRIFNLMLGSALYSGYTKTV